MNNAMASLVYARPIFSVNIFDRSRSGRQVIGNGGKDCHGALGQALPLPRAPSSFLRPLNTSERLLRRLYNCIQKSGHSCIK